MPANDQYATAAAISGASGTVEGTNWDAATEAAFPDRQSVWYTYTPAATGTYLFVADSNSWVAVEVYSGATAGAAVLVDQNAAPLLGGWPLVAGTTYHVAVYGQGSPFVFNGAGFVSPFTLYWSYHPVPANDDFASAQVISGAAGSTGVDGLLGATMEAADPDNADVASPPGYSHRSVWYRWVAPATGTLSLRVEHPDVGARFGGERRSVGVYTGASLASLVRVAYYESADWPWADIAGAAGACVAQSDAAVVAGTTYHIEVADDGSVPEQNGRHVLHWRLAAATLWNSVWGHPVPPVPLPGTNATGNASLLSHAQPWASFGGTVLPTPVDAAGAQWAPTTWSDPPLAITADGLVFSGVVGAGNDQELDYGIPPDMATPGYYVPHEGSTYEVGWQSDGWVWVTRSSDSSGPFASLTSPVVGLNFSIYSKQATVSVRGPSGYTGGHAYADGRRYRARFVYEPAVLYPPTTFISAVDQLYYYVDDVHLESLTPDWEDSTLDVRHGVITGRAAGLCGARWGVAADADCDTMVQLGRLGDPLYLGQRVVAASGTDFSGYFARVSADGHVALVRRAGGTDTVLATTAAPVVRESWWTRNVWLALRCVGSTISVWYIQRDVGLEPVRLLQATDTTYTAAGHMALLVDSSGDRSRGMLAVKQGTATNLIVGRTRVYVTTDAGATWQVISEGTGTTEEFSAFRDNVYVDAYDMGVDGRPWSFTWEGWGDVPVPVSPPYSTVLVKRVGA